MKHTVATTGDRLDQIIYQYYKTLDVMNEVLMSNVHLMSKPILDTGDKVYLPDIEVPEQPENGVNLW
ncbi:tail protein X [Sulfuricurvum sp.]|uniref:tail protein X n=1 Tax=Sulfuricurvum sp. TaxID=2025608 RepID=UPI002617A927|nr:tail protein X [Sulfuricurvum sp.]MDD2267005.1 tail protein X [Sulfuricurvum sp.]MDD2782621.1 tail protein X [Sulfuricurvum sp.]